MQEQTASGTPWTDPEFPPERISLYDPVIDDRAETYGSKTELSARFDQFEWKRAGEIFKNPQIFSDGIHPNDIK